MTTDTLKGGGATHAACSTASFSCFKLMQLSSGRVEISVDKSVALNCAPDEIIAARAKKIITRIG